MYLNVSSLCPHLANRVRFTGIRRQNALCVPLSASDFEPVPWRLLEITAGRGVFVQKQLLWQTVLNIFYFTVCFTTNAIGLQK